MKNVNYVAPNAELIEFKEESIMTTSPQRCNCGVWVGNHQLGQEGCNKGTMSDASEYDEDTTNF